LRRIAVILILASLVATRASADPAETSAPAAKRGKIIAAASIGAVHLAYATWSYFAWYRDHDREAFHIEHSHGFSAATYAGGADKLGHVWTNYALTRGTTALLVLGGWKRAPSSLVAAGLAEVAFTLTEIEDGFVYGFDRADVAANLAGAAVGVLLENFPAVDRMIDFKLQYFPSSAYRYQLRTSGSVDVGQDYTGQSYLLSLHLGALPRATTNEYLYWTRFTDFSIGFEAKHYVPEPEMRENAPKQTLYLGLSINMQGVLSELFPPSTGRSIGRGTFEVYALPYTTFRFAEASRSP
jgi:hypothetical protein